MFLVLSSAKYATPAHANNGPTVGHQATPTAKLLVPRIGDFERQNPQVTLRLAASYKLIDLATELDIDVAIRLGRGDWPGVHATRLTASHVFPVCSPGLARNLRRPRDILQHRRLLDDKMYDEWGRWFTAAGVDDQPGETRRIDDDNMLLQAAIQGQGVTLARAIIAQDDLETGRLVQPFDVSILSAFQYYFVCLPERLKESDIQAFQNWLRRTMP